MYIEISANSDKGLVRDRNEDMILLEKEFVRDDTLTRNVTINQDDRFVAAVADGMGGHRRGDVASEEVLKELTAFFYKLPSGLSSKELIKEFKEWVQVEHLNLLKQGILSAYLKDMGTTLVGLVVYERKIFWLNCGDSRIYRLRNDILCQLSKDHSLREMAGHEDAPANVIMNSIGAGASVFLDIVDITDTVYDQDAFLLCSDGLTDTLHDDEVEQLLLHSSVDKLVDTALKSGAKDNVSVCLIKFSDIDWQGDSDSSAEN